MKVAVTAMGGGLADDVSLRFGRCPYFVIVDTDNMTVVEAIENPNIAAGGGAGIQSAQLMADRGVEAILTGNCGPNAFQVFGAAGIDVLVGVSGTVKEAVDAFKAGTLQKAGEANVASHHGMGGGMGRGAGQGTGRGMGMKAGTTAPAATESSPEALEDRVRALEEELAKLKKRIAALGEG